MNFNFSQDSLDVARNLIGRYIETGSRPLHENVYRISATKAYRGESIRTRDKERQYAPGVIMMFNLRGHPHTCISTSSNQEQDYVLISGLLDSNGRPINSCERVTLELGLSMHSEGRFYRDFFEIQGDASEDFTQKQGDAPTCLGQFYLVR